MSSALASYSQVPVRAKYFMAYDGVESTQLAEEDLLSWAADNNVQTAGSVMKFDTLAQFTDAWGPNFNVENVFSSTLVKDMGKSYYINVAGTVYLEYRLVQRVNSGDAADGYPSASEGVPPNYSNSSPSINNYGTDSGKFLICVFSADNGDGNLGYDYVQFGRTG